MSSMTPEKLQNLIEAALMVYGKPMSIDKLMQLFEEEQRPSTSELREAISALNESYESRGVELKEVASGYRFQAKQEYATWIARLWEERAPRYSRALLETMALIAYRQPITRSEIEDVRGVSVSSHIVKTLLEREWVRVVGHRDVPGRPALYATTKDFLDYFNLKSLEELPTLSEIRDLDKINAELDFDESQSSDDNANESSSEALKNSETADTEIADSEARDSSDANDSETIDSETKDTDTVNSEVEQANTEHKSDTTDSDALGSGIADPESESESESEPEFEAESSDEQTTTEPAVHKTVQQLAEEASVSEHRVKRDLSDEELMEEADLAKSNNLQADEAVFNDAYQSAEFESETADSGSISSENSEQETSEQSNESSLSDDSESSDDDTHSSLERS